MAALPSTRWLDEIHRQIKFHNRSFLFAAISIQLLLGLLFGHQYDMRIFMATGYLVGTGQNPYLPQDLSAIFQGQAFHGMTSIGYPPPWALVLGLIYRAIYTWVPSLLVYNLAIKIPIIAANICLAYLTHWLLTSIGADGERSRRAWIFLMLNPLLFYFGSAWGQFDAIVACLALMGIVFLYQERLGLSAVFLALSLSFKPTSLPVLPVALLFLLGAERKRILHFIAIFLFSAGVFIVIPFIVFRWDPAVIFANWNAHFTVGGGMSFMTFLELMGNSYQLPGLWWLAGMVWVPALLVGMLFLKPGNQGIIDLLKKSLAFIMIFFLTRAWLSEPNVILILPFVVILTVTGDLDRRILIAVSVLPLVFTVLNTSPPQLLFLKPNWMANLLHLEDSYRVARLLARTLLVIPWQIVGWWTVITCLSRRSAGVVSQPIGSKPLSLKG